VLVAAPTPFSSHTDTPCSPPLHSSHCAVSPIIDKDTGEAVALVVVGSGGRQFIAAVDPARPSRLLLKEKETGVVYSLQVGGQEAVCGVNGREWEQVGGSGRAGSHSPMPPHLFVRTLFCCADAGGPRAH